MRRALLILALCLVPEMARAACTTTLSAGANVATAISSAAAGDTICLNSGAYGTVTLGTFTKSPRVVVQAVTPLGPTMGLDIQSAANGVTFDGMTMSGGIWIAGANNKNLTFQNSAFGTAQLVIVSTSFNNNNILIDNNTFGAFSAGVSDYEGRLEVVGDDVNAAGVTITNNTFGPNGCSDGIQVAGRGVVIGPGNVFTGIVQGSCGVHVDAIQGFGQTHTTINGNYFINNTINIGMYDGGASETITNNVFAPPNEALQNLQLAAIQGLTLAHNTFRSTTVAAGAKAGDPVPTGWVVQNNLFIASDFVAGGDQPGCGADCIMRYNLKDGTSSTNPAGTNTVSGSPTFVNGSPPSTWAGYQLTAASLGYQAGNDGQDMGTTYYGAAAATISHAISGSVALSGGVVMQ